MLYTLAGGGTLCGVAALVLLIVSTATDFWMQYRYSGSSANQGLWRFCINHKCHAHTITVGEWSNVQMQQEIRKLIPKSIQNYLQKWKERGYLTAVTPEQASNHQT